ncbi:HutR like protein, partial [Vibrio parahaemolyticus]|nr:HutR like protein [Vibrio parahaemolyticus]
MKKLITVLSLTLASQTAIAAQECSTDFAKTAPNTRYTYSESGTVTDLKTGLT